MEKKKLKSYLIKALLLMLLLALIQFFFNPLGLGPEPSSVLTPAFFKTTVKSMTGVELLIDGKEAFDAINKCLDSASSSIHIQTYIWKDDKTGGDVVRR